MLIPSPDHSPHFYETKSPRLLSVSISLLSVFSPAKPPLVPHLVGAQVPATHIPAQIFFFFFPIFWLKLLQLLSVFRLGLVSSRSPPPSSPFSIQRSHRRCQLLCLLCQKVYS